MSARPTTVRVALGERAYTIWITGDRYRQLGAVCRALGLGLRGIVVTNASTRRVVGGAVMRSLTRAGWDIDVLEVPDTERAKSPAVALRLIEQVARRARRQSPTLFAVGGGVVGDVTGYVASVFRRGVPYVQVPTTLLAQVDSSIGGKVGIDLPAGKNLVGSFYQPRAVYSDVTALRTLPARQLRSGLGEIIKYAAMADPVLWARLIERRARILRGSPEELAWLVARCAAIKGRIVARDEREVRGVRTLLNFGHTAGHAIEAAVRYSSAFTHGEAIAVGMMVAAELGQALGMTPAAVCAQLEQIFRAYGLPVTAPRVPVRRALQAMMYDKKFLAGRQRWVLLRRIGHAVVMQGVPPATVAAIVRRRIGRTRQHP